jgi:hypothetical protein
LYQGRSGPQIAHKLGEEYRLVTLIPEPIIEPYGGLIQVLDSIHANPAQVLPDCGWSGVAVCGIE